MRAPIHEDDTGTWLAFSFLLITFVIGTLFAMGTYAEKRVNEPATQRFSQ